MIGAIFCVLLALAAALLGLAAARKSRWLHASLCGVCCLLAVYAGLLLGLPVEAVAAMAVAVPGRVPATASQTPTPARARRRPKDIGTAAETAVVRALGELGFPHAERRALAGAYDLGDITGTPGICWEVKGGQQTKAPSDEQVAAWMAETETERVNARADIGVLVLQRHGVGPANAHRWWAYLRANSWILGATKHDIPVRVQLAHACLLLRRAGYGQPFEALAG